VNYYSVKAFSTVSVQYEEPSVIFIEPGMNVFNVLTDDIDGFVEVLKADGVRVDEVNKLDGEDAHVITEEDGESWIALPHPPKNSLHE